MIRACQAIIGAAMLIAGCAEHPRRMLLSTSTPPTSQPALPEALVKAEGKDFLVQHVRAIARIDDPAAKAFARRLADVLVHDGIAIPTELAQLAVPGNPVQAVAGEPQRAELIAIAGHLIQHPQRKLPGFDLEVAHADLVEACALYAPSSTVRSHALMVFGVNQPVCGTSYYLEVPEKDTSYPLTDEQLERWLILPARTCRAWKAALEFATTTEGGTVAAEMIGELDGEPLYYYLMALGVADTSATGPKAEAAIRAAVRALASGTRAAARRAKDEAGRTELVKAADNLEKAMKEDENITRFLGEMRERPAARQAAEAFLAATRDGASLFKVKEQREHVEMLAFGVPTRDAEKPEGERTVCVILRAKDREQKSHYIFQRLRLKVDRGVWSVAGAEGVEESGE